MATSKVVVAGSSVSAAQLQDLFRQIKDGSLTGDHLQAVLEHRDPFTVPADPRVQLVAWQTLIRERFGVEVDIDAIKIPACRPGFSRLIVVPAGVTLNQIIQVCRQHFAVWTYVDDLDAGVPTNDRTNEQAYTIWVRDRVEADEELKNLSADDLKQKEIAGITLMERLWLELKVFAETGGHLDVQNVTLCAGSRCSGGGVPYVFWNAGSRGLRVLWCSPDFRYACLLSRAVVSL